MRADLMVLWFADAAKTFDLTFVAVWRWLASHFAHLRKKQRARDMKSEMEKKMGRKDEAPPKKKSKRKEKERKKKKRKKKKKKKKKKKNNSDDTNSDDSSSDSSSSSDDSTGTDDDETVMEVVKAKRVRIPTAKVVARTKVTQGFVPQKPKKRKQEESDSAEDVDADLDDDKEDFGPSYTKGEVCEHSIFFRHIHCAET
jgi:hypothetical protein